MKVLKILKTQQLRHDPVLKKLESEMHELDGVRNANILELHTLYQALRKFCQMTLVNFDYVIQISELETLYPGEVNRICSVQEINEELKNEIFERLIEIWEQ